MVQRSLFPVRVTREELAGLVDRAADLIRTAVDYKFILVLLFLKRVNDLRKFERRRAVERLMREAGLSEQEAEEEADRTPEFYTFNIPKEFLWDEITKSVKDLPERLATAISEIAKLNKELDGVINRVDFLEFARNQENRELLRQLVELFNRYDLGGEEVSPDVLGDAYEHILMRFAPDKAKEGEIYTPREVIRLLVRILDPKPGESVYDPCCGSGGMLISSYLHVVERFGEAEAQRLFLYGQERNPTIYAICHMNMLLHGVKSFHLANGDTLDYPRFKDEAGRLLRFDVVLANPPWNQDGYDADRLKKAEFASERFGFGYCPRQSADWAWIQHMLASAKDNGRVGIVIDNGCLFRGGSEKVIRSKIIEKDWVECVILLPEKLFYNTGAPGAIIVFNKNKPLERRGKILFINASNEFIPHPSVRRLNSLSKTNIDKIVSVYERFVEEAGFSKIVDVNEIRDNDYNLNVTLYVMPVEKGEEIDIFKEFEELKALEAERAETIAKLEEYIQQIKEAMNS
ncbi:MAG: class I SAM-dependent DNA methyltransferase [Candidatus Bathyarchaeia archaeon]